MSTLTYAALTTTRENAKPGTSNTTSPPGLSTYVDAVAALVPAEVLTLHALMLAKTTTTATDPKTQDAVTTISNPIALTFAFYGLIAISILLYVLPRIKTWERLDFFRAIIPPLAFVGWTMLQRSTAFDAVCPQMSDALRTVVALLLAVVLGLCASVLAYKADQTLPPVITSGNT